jgi:hypothetical protein
MHLGNWLLLGVPFTANVVLLALFFVNSSFRPNRIDIRGTFGDLPVIGSVFKRVMAGR